MALIDTPRASPTFVASALLLVLVSAAVQYWSRSRARSKLPPGPTPLPILGNILDIPRNNPWRTFAEWGKLYGMREHPRGRLSILPCAIADSTLSQAMSSTYRCSASRSSC